MAARDVFKELGYYASSVSEIARRCGVSQGTFYQYFKNKDQVLHELHDMILADYRRKADSLSVQGLTPAERLGQVVRLLFDHARENQYFHRILGEFDIIDTVTIGYYDSIAHHLRRFLREESSKGFLRPVDPNLLAYGLIGMASFHAMDWPREVGVFETEQVVDWTVRLLGKGISGPKEWTKPADLAILSPLNVAERVVPREEDLTQGQMTARAIFQAAERVFGQYGFNGATISEITREAKLAQGTFYVHFKTKRDLLGGFVQYLSRHIRRELSLATEGLEDRRDVERVGALALFRFLSAHRRIYRVLVESETAGQEMAMWYYKKMAEGYVSGIEEGMKRGEIRQDLPATFMVRSIMGLLHMIGLKWLVWNSSPRAEVGHHLLRDVVSLILDGLDPI
jgi:AcrR family transcriptional regulator